MSEITLLGSVFLPASVFGPLADDLAARGHHVRIATAGPAVTAAATLEAYRVALGDTGGAIGVAHSNAGTFVPSLAAEGRLGAVVFMDAVLPSPDGGSLPAVRPDLARALRARVVDGALPRWTEWWPVDVVRPLFPDEASFTAVHASAPRVPAEYLDAVVQVPASWTDGLRAAYLAFGDTYADERRAARSLGWPTRRLELGHLGQLEHPRAVADAVLELTGE